MNPDLCVVGSVNLDIVVSVPHHPAAGETVLGDARRDLHGGKGANQAVAAARLGSRVAFVGRVGDDAVGTRLREGLARERVDVTHLRTDPDAPSGTALIAVDTTGENMIIVVPGANGRVGPSDVTAAGVPLAAARVTLLGHEVPEAAVLAAARAAGGTVVLNPAPARPLPRALLDRADVLVPNRGELHALTGRTGDPADLARALHPAVVVTLGADGALVVTDVAVTHIQAPRVDVADTTGAGDAFCGALAHALAQGDTLLDAAGRAVATAADSVTRPGARG